MTAGLLLEGDRREHGASAGKSNVNDVPSVELAAPNTDFREGRNNQVDLRLSREFAWEWFKIRPTLDVFNAVNANPVLENEYQDRNVERGRAQTVSNRWQKAIAALGARIVKFGVKVET